MSHQLVSFWEASVCRSSTVLEGAVEDDPPSGSPAASGSLSACFFVTPLVIVPTLSVPSFAVPAFVLSIPAFRLFHLAQIISPHITTAISHTMDLRNAIRGSEQSRHVQPLSVRFR